MATGVREERVKAGCDSAGVKLISSLLVGGGSDGGGDGGATATPAGRTAVLQPLTSTTNGRIHEIKR